MFRSAILYMLLENDIYQRDKKSQKSCFEICIRVFLAIFSHLLPYNIYYKMYFYFSISAKIVYSLILLEFQKYKKSFFIIISSTLSTKKSLEDLFPIL